MMENTFVKNVELLELSPEQLELLERRAALHLRYSNLDFKVLEVRPDAVVLRIRQGRSHAENYFDVKRLIGIGHETFDDVIGGRRIESRPIPYRPSPPDVVDAAWLQQRRGQTPIKSIAHELGVDANNVSSYFSGNKPLSGVTRAMFYWYFKNAGK